MRSCDGCTKCCEGSLVTVAMGHEIGPKPCPLVQPGIGCGIGDQRPDSPCKSFLCAWLTDLSIPRGARPDKSGLIPMYRQTSDGETFLFLKRCNEVDPAILSWYVQTASERGMNLAWDLLDSSHWIGTETFHAYMREVESSGTLG